ncbi:MAG: hypothetical protein SFY56_00655 [Bacteroidota bacterium]|nr:hypothetical protein [Bacteroidota bacterium]
MKKIILFLCIVFMQQSYSQRRYTPGVVYLRNNDSVVGKIKDQLFLSTRKIKFIGKEGKVKKYSVREITGYKKLGLLKYLVIPLGISMRFMRVIEDGDLILLEYIRSSGGMSYGGGSYAGGGYGGGYGGGMHTSTSGSSTQYYIKKARTNKSGRVPLIGFKNFMLDYIGDDPEVKKLVEEKSLVSRDIFLIVKKYNENKRTKN